MVAVEAGRSAADLRHNAARARLKVEVVTGQVEEFLAAGQDSAGFRIWRTRRGPAWESRFRAITRLCAPPTLVIVSCDPATLARDLAVLAPAYEIQRITLVDLFPQTFHMETIVKLGLR